MGKERDPLGLNIKKFIGATARAEREEQVIDAYQKLFHQEEWQRPFGTDGLVLDTLFEMKLDEKLDGTAGHRGLAQCCGYLRKIQRVGMYKKKHYEMPTKAVICDKNQALVVNVASFNSYFEDDKYEWFRPPSIPDPVLVEDLKDIRLIPYDMTNEIGIKAFFAELQTGSSRIFQEITIENFAEVFKVWKEQFAIGLEPEAATLAFLLDLQQQAEVEETNGTITYKTHNNRSMVVQANIAAYRQFWRYYQLPPGDKALTELLKRKDWLVLMSTRRSTGEFFTPEDFAKEAQKTILKHFPDAFDKYIMWDPACGTGNLEVDLAPMPGRLFMSTLQQEDLDVISGSKMDKILGAKAFKYDFLNQPDSDLPKDLLAQLTPKNKVMFFLNPPFAAGAEFDSPANSKVNCSDTKIGNLMQPTTGRARQNIMAQFMWRIGELINKNQLAGVVGVFSSINWVTGTSYQKFRADWESKFEFVDAFCFCSEEFEGTSGKWPCAFSLWRSK